MCVAWLKYRRFGYSIGCLRSLGDNWAYCRALRAGVVLELEVNVRDTSISVLSRCRKIV
jgi:hypothetical protein